MNFFKKNLFYVMMTAVVLAIVVGALFIASGPNEEVDEGIAVRESMFQRMGRLKNTHINAEVVRAERQRLDKLRQQAAEALQLSVQHNRDKLQMLKYPSTKEMLFPLDNATLQREGTYPLMREYLDQLELLRGQMKPITPYTDEELAQEVAHQVRLIEARAATQAAVPTLSVGGPAAPRAGDVPAPVATDEAKKEAVRLLLRRKAGEGRMYLEWDALDRYISRPRADASPVELWWMQVNLWVQADIVAAIVRTNESVSRENVAFSPIKHLVKIKVEPKYVGAKTSGASGAPVDAMPHPFSMSPGIATVDPGWAGISDATAVSTGSSITMRTSNTDYDVVRYVLTVYMPSRYVADFQRNLMAGNYHTILNVVEMAPVSEDSRRYYGGDSVMKVTMEGEMLFLTAWERGTVDPKDPAKYIYPPLMPVKVLETLPEAARRQQDIERIAKP